MHSAHLIEDHVGVLQRFNFLFAACNLLSIVRARVDACRLELGKLRKCISLQHCMRVEVFLVICKVSCGRFHLTFLGSNVTLLCINVGLSVTLVRVELGLGIIFRCLGGINRSFEVRLDHVKLANDTSGCILIATEITREGVRCEVPNCHARSIPLRRFVLSLSLDQCIVIEILQNLHGLGDTCETSIGISQGFCVVCFLLTTQFRCFVESFRELCHFGHERGDFFFELCNLGLCCRLGCQVAF